MPISCHCAQFARRSVAEAELCGSQVHVCRHHLSSEGVQSQPRQFELLVSERDSDDGDVKQRTEKDVDATYPEASEEEPQDVHRGVETTVLLFVEHHFLPEWPQHVDSDFERLQAEGNADDGEHHGKT